MFYRVISKKDGYSHPFLVVNDATFWIKEFKPAPPFISVRRLIAFKKVAKFLVIVQCLLNAIICQMLLGFYDLEYVVGFVVDQSVNLDIIWFPPLLRNIPFFKNIEDFVFWFLFFLVILGEPSERKCKIVMMLPPKDSWKLRLLDGLEFCGSDYEFVCFCQLIFMDGLEFRGSSY